MKNSTVINQNPMNNEKIDHYLNRHRLVSDLVCHRQGVWTFQFAEVEAYIMTDDREGVDRMRIMAQISDNPQLISQVSPERLLQANCHKALDARFCYEHDGSLWSAFIHRLSTLNELDLESGLHQVTGLVKGFPFELSSLNFYFRGTS